ncbi:hydantoin racemase [Nocardioides sp. JQ2195]|uniref:aspartate/glutamate racemase family protein n=1 Tax=Nocardioides sp. JQ2195 TaxID=2592334 RepID=UPI00143E26DB|nr:aspartate/glutamate racemase family protein [Nocardioides sp. JQ2195]QIX25571.1 hydantoin racemase [Nocardioides sp. JQ2195]
MRIWHQSFTVLDDVPHYRDALARHLAAQAAPGTKVDLHGMQPGTYPSDYPGTHIGHAYLAGLHKEQFVQAALRAQDEGYDAFLIATIPDTAFEEVRTLVDIPVVTFGQTSVLMAAQLGDCVGIVNFIAALEPQLRRNLRNYRLDALVGPITQVDAAFTDVMAAYDDPEPLLDAFRTAARRAIADGATVVVPGEGPLNVFLADQGVSRVDDVPVLDSLGTCVRVAELRAAQFAATGLHPSRVGFFGSRPERPLVDAARSFYGIPQGLG